MALQKGGFNLTKFWSSTTKVLDFLIDPKTKNNGTTHRVLEVKWDTMNDTFIIRPVLKNNLTAKERSVRKILSTVARVFYSLGLIAPFVITLKIMFKKLWMFLNRVWVRIKKFLKNTSQLSKNWPNSKDQKLVRFIGQIDRHSDIQLHVFTKASQCAMAACISVRISNQAHKQ